MGIQKNRTRSKKKKSKFEQNVQKELKAKKVKFDYETYTYDIYIRVTGHECGECGEVKNIYKRVRYTPDWFLGNGIIIESKGIFTPMDRKKILGMKEQYATEVKMLFEKDRDNKLSKTTQTRYSDWCRDNEVDYAFGSIPDEWLAEE